MKVRVSMFAQGGIVFASLAVVGREAIGREARAFNGGGEGAGGVDTISGWGRGGDDLSWLRHRGRRWRRRPRRGGLLRR